MGAGYDPIHDDPEFLALRRQFVLEARDNVREMAELLARAGDALPVEDRGIRFRKLAHDLRGSGGSYGFPIVSLYSGEAEDTYLEGGDAKALRAIVTMLGQSILQAGVLVGAADA
jgi:hypothetical protein